MSIVVQYVITPDNHYKDKTVKKNQSTGKYM